MTEEKTIETLNNIKNDSNTKKLKDDLWILKQYWLNILNIVNSFDFNPVVAAELTNKLQEVRKCIWENSTNNNDYKCETVNMKAR